MYFPLALLDNLKLREYQCCLTETFYINTLQERRIKYNQCMQVARQKIDVINLVEKQQFKVDWLGSDTDMGLCL